MNNEQMYELYESNIREIKAIDNLFNSSFQWR